MRRRHPHVALALWILALGGCAGPTSDLSITTSAANGAREQIPATVAKPDGAGPFPAVVIMHDCSGLGPSGSGAPNRWGFAAAVALYPACATRGLRDPSGVYKPSAPLLILIGDKDDWTPAEPCRQLAGAAQKAAQPVGAFFGQHLGGDRRGR